jgi:nucleoside 2-deoxyribosyltransferase
MKITIICPVRNGTPQEVIDYVAKLENEGHQVHFPPRDNPQSDPIGYDICNTMRNAIDWCDEVRVIYNPNSQGTHFDLGMAFALHKKVIIMNDPNDNTPGKSYIKVFRYAIDKGIS